MALVPQLRVVPLSKVMRHEEVDPLRVEHLANRLNRDNLQVNPVICAEVESEFVVLDGATRTEACRSIGLEFLVVQVVDPADVTLETWHHVIRQGEADAILERIESEADLTLNGVDSPPRITTSNRDVLSVVGSELSVNATMSALVDTYVGQSEVSRIIDPAVEVVDRRFPNWSAIVEFPRLDIDQVLKAALGEDLLPAGVTRFLIPERVLRINVDLALLRRESDLAEKQRELDHLIQTRSTAGRVRRYEETVIILDD